MPLGGSQKTPAGAMSGGGARPQRHFFPFTYVCFFHPDAAPVRAAGSLQFGGARHILQDHKLGDVRVAEVRSNKQYCMKSKILNSLNQVLRSNLLTSVIHLIFWTKTSLSLSSATRWNAAESTCDRKEPTIGPSFSGVG